MDGIITLFDTTKYYHKSTSSNTVNGTVNGTVEMPLKGGVSITSHIPDYCCSATSLIGGDNNSGASIWQTVKGEFDDIIAPITPIMLSSHLGIMFGSVASHTLPEYHTQTAKYLIVLSGEITVKMTSIRNCEKLNGGHCKQKTISGSNSCFTHFYCNGVNIWNQENIKLQKLPFLKFNVAPGYALSIPPFCIWSVMYKQPGTVVFTVDYISFINSIANIHHWFQYSPLYNSDDNGDDNSDDKPKLKWTDIDYNDDIIGDNNDDIIGDNNDDIIGDNVDNNDDIIGDNNDDISGDNNDDISVDNNDDISVDNVDTNDEL
jgi:hypothetical protein